MNFWNMQLHPDNKDEFTLNDFQKVLEKGIVGMGKEWGNDRGQPKHFKTEAKIGDIILLRNNGGPQALVEIISDLEENTSELWFDIIRKVKILSCEGEIFKNKYSQNGKKWKEGIFLLNTFSKINNSPFVKYWYNQVVSTMQNIEQIKTILQSKKQLILQGAPGTGKTYATAEIALRMIGKDIPSDRTELMKMYQEAVKEGQIAFTTFHQSMDYEEFMEGLKPIVEDGKLLYGVKDGIFKEICEKARFVNFTSFEGAYQKMLQEISSQDDEMLLLKTATGKEFGVKINTNQNLTLYTGNREKSMGTLTQSNILLSFDDNVQFSGWESYFKSIGNYLKDKFNFDPNAKNEFKNYVLIIDEINRGNISKIFGELITLLEADKRIGETNEIEVNLPYSQMKFGVPSNVYIIGTMNTTDRSLGYIDYAVRRRFAFHTLKADKTVITNENAKALFEMIETLIKDNLNKVDFNIDDIMIGHSYFICTSDEDLNLKLDYEIKPLLREYVKDGILNMSDEILNSINSLTI